jgi:hypothetical protein
MDDADNFIGKDLISAEKHLTRKEVNTMNYAKPQINVIAAATTAIQDQRPGSKNGSPLDGQGTDKFVTASAYQADE